MTPDQEERLVSALEKLAESVYMIALTHHAEFNSAHPLRIPGELTVTRLKTDEDLIMEEHGASGEPIEKWTDIGSREQEFERDAGLGAGVEKAAKR